MVILRGQVCKIDEFKKYLYVHILKPKDRLFSLSDKIVSYIKKGYTIDVTLPLRHIEINSQTPILFREEVKTKFPNSPNWYRYWYAIPSKEKELQYEMF